MSRNRSTRASHPFFSPLGVPIPYRVVGSKNDSKVSRRDHHQVALPYLFQAPQRGSSTRPRLVSRSVSTPLESGAGRGALRRLASGCVRSHAQEHRRRSPRLFEGPHPVLFRVAAGQAAPCIDRGVPESELHASPLLSHWLLRQRQQHLRLH